MIRTRLLITAVLILLFAALASAQVRLAQVPGQPGTLDHSTTVVFKASGNTGFMSNPGSGLVQKFRGSTGEILGSLSLPPGVGPLALSFDERTLVVLGVTRQRFYIINADTMELRTPDGIGYQPSGFTFRNNIVMSRDGINFYVADPSRNHLAVFNTITKQLDRFIPVDKNPNILTLLPNGQHIAVLCSGKRAEDQESIWIVDTITIGVIDNPVFGGAKTEPFNNVQSTISGGYFFAGSYDDNRILTYDLKSKIPGSRAMLGGKGPAKLVSSLNGRWLAVVNVVSKTVELMSLPEALAVKSLEFPGFEPTTETLPAFSPDSHTLYIPAAGTNDIIAYDVENFAIRKRIPTGANPVRLGLSGDGTVLTSLDLGGNVLSLIAINPIPRFIPDLTQSAGVYSGLALANFGTEGANIALIAKDNSGVLLPGSTNPRLLTLPASQQMSLVASQIFGLDPNQNYEGYIEAYTVSAGASILYLTGTNDLTQLDGFLADSRVGKLLGFGRITEGVSKYGSQTGTDIALLNPTETDALITVRMFAKTLEGPGAMIAYLNIKLPAHARVRKPISQLVPTAFYPLARGYLEISSDVDIKGLALVKIGDSTALIPAAFRGDPETTFDAVQFASGGAGVLDTPIFSSLSITNVATEPIKFTAQVTDDRGEIIPADSTPVERTVQPYESISGGADEILGFPDPLTDPALYQGTLHMVAEKKGLIVTLLYGDARNGKYLASGSLLATRSTRFMMTHFAEGAFDESAKGQYYTGIALYNPNRMQANVVVEAFSPKNVSLGKSNVLLERNSRVSATLGQLIPALQGKANTGSVIVTSDLPVTTFEVFGSSRSEFLVSVPPLVQAAP